VSTRPYTVRSRNADGRGMPFDAKCRECPVTSSGWDYEYNARESIRRHVAKEHPEKVNW